MTNRDASPSYRHARNSPEDSLISTGSGPQCGTGKGSAPSSSIGGSLAVHGVQTVPMRARTSPGNRSYSDSPCSQPDGRPSFRSRCRRAGRGQAGNSRGGCPSADDGRPDPVTTRRPGATGVTGPSAVRRFDSPMEVRTDTTASTGNDIPDGAPGVVEPRPEVVMLRDEQRFEARLVRCGQQIQQAIAKGLTPPAACRGSGCRRAIAASSGEPDAPRAVEQRRGQRPAPTDRRALLSAAAVASTTRIVAAGGMVKAWARRQHRAKAWVGGKNPPGHA